MDSQENRYSVEQLGTMKLADMKALRERNPKRQKRSRLPPLLPQDRSSSAPLSYAQERLWFLDQLGLVGPAYNMSMALHLDGDLDVSALEMSFSELIRRHESLRTRFESRPEGPVEVVAPARPFELERHDLSDQPEEIRDEQARMLGNHFAQRLFDLSRGPLIRTLLIELNSRRHVLVLSMHHIASDGWSLEVLNRELSVLYRAYSQGLQSPLQELPVQYADYAIWQRQWLQGEAIRNHLRYWRDQLAGASPHINLPTDRPRPAVASFRGALLTFEIPKLLRSRLEELARAEGATLFMVVMAAYQILLSRYSGQKDIVVGSAIAGRRHPQVENLVGFFVNTLMIRTDLSDTSSFREYLARVKEVTLAAYAHQDLPFGKLVMELRPERNLAHQPLFQVALALQNYPQETLDLPGLEWRWTEPDQQTALFDLTLHLYQVADGLRGVFEYSTDLFDAETVQRMSCHYTSLLEGLSTRPDCSIDDVDLQTAAERQQLIQWRGRENLLHLDHDAVSVLEKLASTQPHSVAIRDAERVLTYELLNESANRLSRHLRNRDVRAKDRVGVYMSRSLEWVVGFYGILKAGATYVPLDPSHPRERLSNICADADIVHILSRSRDPSAADLTSVESTVVDEYLANDVGLRMDGNPPIPSDPMMPAYAIYTSGSTGKPKGVLLHRLGLANVMEAQRHAFGLEAHEHVLQFASISFDASVFDLMLALGAGACLVVGSREELLPGPNLAAFVQSHSISTITLTPSALAAMSPGDVPSLRTLIVAGEEFPPDLARAWLPSRRIFNAYGPTETTIWATTHECTPACVEARIPIGKPIDNSRVYVLRRGSRQAAIGEVGELCIGGPGVALGYINRPDLTADRFTDDPVLFGQGRIYRTGDLGRCRADGTLEFLGRGDNQVKIRGHRIELAEIEAVLSEHPAVRQAVVLAREDEPGERRLVSYVVADRTAALAALQGELSAKPHSSIVGEWEALYEETYSDATPTKSSPFVGWNSSFTGQPIPEDEMRAWLAGTLDRIRALRPRKVLEIGCGLGLIAREIAPGCESYVGTDISTGALKKLRQWLDEREVSKNVQLMHRSASDLQDLESRSFDTLILNSVVQYFPDIDYLMAVLQEAVRLVGPGGSLFIGDVRHLGCLAMFHSFVQLSKSAANDSAVNLRRRAARAVAQEKELVIDPAFFQSLAGRLQGISAVEIQLKRGQHRNELIQYRYDVVLYTGNRVQAPMDGETIDWNSGAAPLADLEGTLAERRSRAFSLKSIPNARLVAHAAAHAMIASAEDRTDVATLRRRLAERPSQSIDPELFWALGERFGYEAHVTWSTSDPTRYFDVQFLDRQFAGDLPSTDSRIPDSVPAWNIYANDPVGGRIKQLLIPHLREFLRARLPEFMIPTAWMAMDQFPLTSSGKTDRKALPAPQVQSAQASEYIAPRNDVERQLADIWAQVLRIDQVGAQDNFFELGGHSLLIVQVIDRLRQVGLSLDVKSIYATPTLADLARILTSKAESEAKIPPNLIPTPCDMITPPMLPLVDLTASEIYEVVSRVRGGAPNVQDIYPLAPLQEGILFHHVLNPNGVDTYVRSMAFSLASRVMLDEFTDALQRVIDRHDVLRTAVMWEDLPCPIQVVQRRAALPVSEFQLADGQDELAQLMDRMALEQQKFDLRVAPMMRLEVARVSREDRWLAILRTHHLLCDNESADIMIAEVMAYLDEPGSELPEPVPFRNHVAQALIHAREHDAREFFVRKLADVVEPTAPFGLLDVHGDGSNIREARSSLDPELARRIRHQARRLNVSAATVFHAAWGLVISSTTGRDDVVFGTVLLGRLGGSAGAQRILGMFINTLPLRLRLRSVSAAELVRMTQQELAELLQHEQSSLAVAQSCSAVAAGTPLFSSLLNFRHKAVDLETGFSQVPGLSLLASRGRTNYPILLSVDDAETGFQLEMETDQRIDPRRLLDFMSEALQSLVAALEKTPDKPALGLSVLPMHERQLILDSYSPEQRREPSQELIHELFQKQVERSPNNLAVTCEGASLSYLELNSRANQIARHLKKRGVGADDRVAICIHRGLDMVAAILGTLKAGAGYLPLDPTLPADRLAYMLADAQPRILLTEGELQSLVSGTSVETIALDQERDSISRESVHNLPLDESTPRSSNLAYVIYTSGSTGKPKGVMIEHRSVTRLFAATDQWFEFSERDVWTLFHSFGFDFSVWELWGALLHGGRLVVVPQATARSPRQFYELLCAEAVTVLNQTPSAFAQVIEEQARDSGRKHALRVVIFGGEALEPGILRPWIDLNGAEKPRLVNMYGITETTVHVTYCELTESDISSEQTSVIGRPISDLGVYVLDAQQQPAPLGVVGEIYVAGAGVARGYLNRPEITAQRFVANPFSADPADRLYRSGDLGLWRPDGTLEYRGRNDQQVKIRGYRIELGEIESALTRLAGVRQAVVVVRQDRSADTRLVAYVILNNPAGSQASGEIGVWRSQLKAELPDYMVPAALVVLEQFPLTPNGKLDRQALPAPEIQAYVSAAYEAPSTEVEWVLARIWADLLRVERVGRDDSFFELGGHSLLAMQVIVRIQAKLLIDLPVAALFEAPTLRQLSNRIDELRRARLLESISDGSDDMEQLLESVASMSESKVQELMRELTRGA